MTFTFTGLNCVVFCFFSLLLESGKSQCPPLWCEGCHDQERGCGEGFEPLVTEQRGIHSDLCAKCL